MRECKLHAPVPTNSDLVNFGAEKKSPARSRNFFYILGIFFFFLENLLTSEFRNSERKRLWKLGIFRIRNLGIWKNGNFGNLEFLDFGI